MLYCRIALLVVIAWLTHADELPRRVISSQLLLMDEELIPPQYLAWIITSYSLPVVNGIFRRTNLPTR